MNSDKLGERELKNNCVPLANDIIEARIRRILERNIELPLPSEQIDNDTDLLSLGINSITFVKIAVAIETEFEFEFEDGYLDYEKFLNLNSLISYIKSKQI